MTAIPVYIDEAPAPHKVQVLPRTCIERARRRRHQARLRLRTTSPQVLYQGGIIAHRAAAARIVRRRTLRAVVVGVVLAVLGVVAVVLLARGGR